MHASRLGARSLIVGAAVFALVAVAAGGTLAASTNPPTLYACFNTSGQVSMATVPQCKLAGGGQLAYWSTVPQPGPTGPTGAAGPTGAQGATGPTGGLSGYEIVHATGTETLLAWINWAWAFCPSGKLPVGGGGTAGFYSPTAFEYGGQIVGTAPYESQGQHGWTVGWSMPDGSTAPSNWTMRWDIWVVCATAAA